MLSRSYIEDRMANSITDTEKTQVEQNYLLLSILEKLTELVDGKEVKKVDKNRNTKKSVEPTEGRE